MIGEGDVVGFLVGLLLLVVKAVRLTVMLTKDVAFSVLEVVSNRFELQIVSNNNIRQERCRVVGSLLARPNEGCKHIASLLLSKVILARCSRYVKLCVQQLSI
jgi:hypothetical protein